MNSKIWVASAAVAAALILTAPAQAGIFGGGSGAVGGMFGAGGGTGRRYARRTVRWHGWGRRADGSGDLAGQGGFARRELRPYRDRRCRL